MRFKNQLGISILVAMVFSAVVGLLVTGVTPSAFGQTTPNPYVQADAPAKAPLSTSAAGSSPGSGQIRQSGPPSMAYHPNGRNRVVPGRTFLLYPRNLSVAPTVKPNAAWLVQTTLKNNAEVEYRALAVPIHDVVMTMSESQKQEPAIILEIPSWWTIRSFFDLPAIAGMWRASEVSLCLGSVHVPADSGVVDLSSVGIAPEAVAKPVEAGWAVRSQQWNGDAASSAGLTCGWFANLSTPKAAAAISPSPSSAGPMVTVHNLGGMQVELANRVSSLLWAFLGLFLCWAALWLALWQADLKCTGRPPNPISVIACLVEKDGKASLSRLQMAIWTFVTAFGLIYVWAMDERFIEIPPDVLWFLGIGGATLAVRNLLPQMEYADEPIAGPRARLAELIAVNGRVDLTRVQMLVFTAILAIIVLKEIAEHGRFPDFDKGVVMLTGVSSLTYLAGTKNTAKKTPTNSDTEPK